MDTCSRPMSYQGGQTLNSLAGRNIVFSECSFVAFEHTCFGWFCCSYTRGNPCVVDLAHNLTFFVNFSFNSQHLKSCRELLGELDAKGEAK